MDVPPLTTQADGSTSSADSPPRRRSWIQLTVLAVLFLAVALTFVRGWNEISSYDWQIDHSSLIVALGFWVVATLGAAICWLMVTRAFGVQLPVALALRVFCTSNLGKYLPGKVLHVFARVYLVQQQGVPVALGTTSTMLDVLLYIAAGMVLSIFALPLALASVIGGEKPGVLVAAAFAILVGLALLHPRVLNGALAFGGRFVPRLRGLRIELRYRAILGAFLLYLVLWVIITAAVYAGVEAVTVVQPMYAPFLGAIFALSYVTGLVTPTPAGVGGREAVMISLFSSFMPLPAAVVATVLNRLLQIGAEAVCAGLLSLVVRR